MRHVELTVRATTLIALLAIVGCAGTPAPANNVAPPVQAATPAADEEVVCRTETPTGSRVGKRVCRTKAQAEAERVETERVSREMERRPRHTDSGR